MADWMELTALVNAGNAVHSSEVARLLRAESDGDDHGIEIDSATGETLEAEILETNTSVQLERLHDELAYRSSLCEETYPFTIEYADAGGFGGSFSIRSVFKGEQKYAFYVLGLLETGIRDKVVALRDVNASHHTLGKLFQVASCLAVGGYLRGETVWFGFPRPSHDDFLPALRSAFARFGTYQVLDHVPPGFPTSLKDAGIDIIAWLDFGDQRGARMMLYGQVASGYDWEYKTLQGHMLRFRNWFQPPAPEHVKSALLIPFPIHHQLDEPANSSWQQSALNHLHYQASDFGVIFDRFRVAKFAARSLSLSEEERNRIDGFDAVEEVSSWIDNVLRELAQSEAA